MSRRMAYRIPEEKYKKVKERLENKNMDFDDFIDITIDLYLDGKINPKSAEQDWGDWMEQK